MAYTRTKMQPVTDQTINAAATYTSAEQDTGASTVVLEPRLFVEVAGFAAAPGGNEEIEVQILPMHVTAGDTFGDNAITYIGAAAADQAYRWEWELNSLPRYFKVAIMNDTGQNTDASAVNAWIEYMAVTA